MPWVRIDENAMDHPKFVAISANAWRLWCEGMTYCQKHLTDGPYPAPGRQGMRYYSPAAVTLLLASLVPGKGPLWHEAEGGYRVHDFHDWNETREKVLAEREWGKRRKELYSDPGLLDAVRRRDGQQCRYCGRSVNWKDRRGPEGGTFDHVIARGPNTMENIVVACRGCNSSKGDRDLATCGMRLITVAELGLGQDGPSPTPRHVTPPHVTSQPKDTTERTAIPDDPRAQVTWLQERYADLHSEIVGVGYIGNAVADYREWCGLLPTFGAELLEKLMVYWLNDQDKFAKDGTRTVAKLRSRASKYAEELKAKKLA
jgi:5-methylcytosine-specific restriction endonuclease McrA